MDHDNNRKGAKAPGFRPEYVHCQWNASWGRPVLQRQLSSATCEQGRSWGYGLRGLWVSKGCRGEFGN